MTASGRRVRPPRPAAAEVFAHPVHLLAFGFGTGLAPVAPGTFGSLPGLALYVACGEVFDPLGLALLALALIAAGIWLCGRSARLLGVHDHPGIVWDEIAGCFLTCALAPAGGWGWWLASFLAFRLFDIIKPWPIRELDHGVPGGLGIMLDDIVAALMAAASLHAARLLLSMTTGS